VAILVDSGILYAYYDRSDRWHAAAGELITREVGALLVPVPVVAEVDHLLGVRLGREARRLFYSGLVNAHYLLVDVPQDRIGRMAEIDHQFADLDLGFVDSAIVAIAEALSVRRIATTDHRHFTPLARVFDFEIVPTAA